MNKTPVEVAEEFAVTLLNLPFYKQVIFEEERVVSPGEIWMERKREIVDILSARLQFIEHYGFKKVS